MDNFVDNRVKIAVILGSLREISYTQMALEVAMKGTKLYNNVEIEFIDLRKYDIPFCDDTEMCYEAPSVIKISEILRSSHGVIIGSPEYHGSLSGVLKNLLDLLSSKDFKDKVVGLIGVAGGSVGASNTLRDMRMIIRHLHGWVVPNQVSIARSRHSFDDTGQIIDPQLETRLIQLGQEVVKFAFLHHSPTALQLFEDWNKLTIEK
ncbi:MAG: NAD(P)H-dependent oxidoreductase [Candidatus Heimdallarchaeota archaeon]|nr:NAD(P)H-dependent oxidoreductase [Candidatus Heimdallarchaeota archaeon]MDH5647704.1 NAD(P)H-dependent oxidoreductase [Candidatus Heimdallarchaeota archaeon]